jgi:N-acetylgalactosamine-6-sulfatase
LKSAGYTTAICGKWHLGYDARFLPLKHGFDYAFGPLGGGIDYFRHNEPGGGHMLYQNDQPVHREGYMTDLIAQEACDFLKRMPGKPFFLYVPFNAPHSPFQGPDDKPSENLTEENFNRGTRATYIKMVERLDDRIGTILKTLDDLGLAQNTLVIFSSDNGGPANSRNDPFSGRKGTTYEGGIRVPCILRWPDKLAAGSESKQVGITMDLTASIVNLAGAKPIAELPPDGIDIVAHLRDQKPDTRRTLFWRQRRGQTTWRGARDGDLKLVSKQDGKAREEWLFDLASDAAEKTDLAQSSPADFRRLKELLARWEDEVRPIR